MKKLLTVFLFVGLVATTAMAGWNFEETVFDFLHADTMLTYGTNLDGEGYYSFSPHGVEVDANGNYWVAFYFTEGEHFVLDNGDTSFYRPLRCFSPEGEIIHEITIFDLPDGGVDTLWAGSVHSGTGRGINLDNDGNIIYSSYAALYRFDPNTAECTGKFFPKAASITAASQASDGTYYVGHVAGGNPAYMLDEDFNLMGNAIDTVLGLQRSLVVRDNPNGGFDMLIGKIYTGINGVHRYHSEDPLFESFAIQDTLVYWPIGETDDEGNPILADPLCSHVEMMPNGHLLVGTLGMSDADAWDPYKGIWMEVDIDKNEMISSFGTLYLAAEGTDHTPDDPYVAGGSNSPRGASFIDENTVVTCDFRTQTIDKWVYDPNSVDEPVEVATTFELGQNYPNPFNPTTTIPFVLNKKEAVTLKVYNMLGQEVATIINNQVRPAGMNAVRFSAENLSSGMYIYKINAGNLQQTRRMMFIK